MEWDKHQGSLAALGTCVFASASTVGVTLGGVPLRCQVRLAVEKLREFIDEPDPNLKYLGLQALQDLRATHPRAVAEHKDTIFQCLHVRTRSIRG